MGLIKEFKEFAMRGNVMDMAVGIIIGAAFTSVVNSLVKDVLMPPLGYAAGGLDFSDKKLVLRPAVEAAPGIKGSPEVALNYGAFINNIISFLIVAFAVFMLVKGMNTLRRKQDAAPPTAPPAPTPDQKLLAEIRDAILQRRSI